MANVGDSLGRLSSLQRIYSSLEVLGWCAGAYAVSASLSGLVSAVDADWQATSPAARRRARSACLSVCQSVRLMDVFDDSTFDAKAKGVRGPSQGQ